MMATATAQRGAALVVSLLMLTVMTLLAVTAVRSSNVSLRIAANDQAHQRVEAVASQAVESALSSKDNFYDPKALTHSHDGITAQIQAADCLHVRPAPGYSARMALAPEETVWEVRATASDPATGAQVNLHQGVKIIMSSGECPL